ncbi:MAG: M20 family metallopeptidase [Planctomycetes bacterium]|nr:M20 family metallopeptidase [Planctomycetota bacterium]
MRKPQESYLRQVRKFADLSYSACMRDLETLVNIDSGHGNIEGLRRFAGISGRLLKKIGCEVRTYDSDVHGPVVVGRLLGKGKARILLLAHMDTIWPAGTCAKRPFVMKGVHAFGPGVADCRSGIAVGSYALKCLTEMGYRGFAEIVLLMNPDEEIGSPFSKWIIRREATKADVALILEAPDHANEFISSRGGMMRYRIEVFGKAAHSGVSPQKGSNAIVELISKLQKAQGLARLSGVTPNVAQISGGTCSGTVPDYAVATYEARITNRAVIAAVDEKLNSLVRANSVPGTRARLEGGLTHPPIERDARSALFIDLVKDCGSVLGMRLKDRFCGGASDGGFCSETGTVSIDGLGPLGARFHTADEQLDTSTIKPRIELLSLLMTAVSENEECWSRKEASR